MKRNFMEGTVSTMAEVYSSGSSGDGNSYDDTINQATIDNSQNSYYLFLILFNPQLTLYGAVIEYTITEPY